MYLYNGETITSFTLFFKSGFSENQNMYGVSSYKHTIPTNALLAPNVVIQYRAGAVLHS